MKDDKKYIGANVEMETFYKLTYICNKYDLVQKEVAGELVKLGIDVFIEKYLK